MSESNMWSKFEIQLQMTGRFAASLPKAREEIKAMLKAKSPTSPPEGAVPLEVLEEEVVEAVDADEEPKASWATFPRDEKLGLYYEGRCVRGHIKDCANILQQLLDIKALRAKVANRVYVETEKISVGKEKPDGTELRYVQVLTRKGPRSSPKWIDYVEKPTLSFVLSVLDDKVVTEDILKKIFEYGGTHGMGQERSQDYGRYNVVSIKKLS